MLTTKYSTESVWPLTLEPAKTSAKHRTLLEMTQVTTEIGKPIRSELRSLWRFLIENLPTINIGRTTSSHKHYRDRHQDYRQAMIQKDNATVQCLAEADALKALDNLSRGENERIIECLRAGSPAFLTCAHSASVNLLVSKKLVRALEGNYHQDYHPFTFYLFAWKAIMKRRDEFMARDAANTSGRVLQAQSLK